MSTLLQNKEVLIAGGSDDNTGLASAELYNPASGTWSFTGSMTTPRGGTDEDLGPGIDATIAGAFALRAAGGQPTAVSAMAAEIAPRHQGKGLAPVMLRAMAALTREAGLAHLIAPVRPSHKDRYPAIPIERYAHWVRDDASPGPGCASPKPATTSSPRAWPGSASTGSRTPASTGNPTSGSSTRSEARDRSAPSALHRYR
jgi:hypothetical protein